MRPTDIDSGLTQERLREILNYDPLTGVFIWVKSRGSVRAGSIAGTLRKDGYYEICIGGRGFLGHRLAWLYVVGEWPVCEVDHRDLDKANNRFDNLRSATHAQNRSNISCWGVSGLKGVYRRGGKDRPYQAAISLSGKQKVLGYFKTPEEAHAVYASAAKEARGEFARFT